MHNRGKSIQNARFTKSEKDCNGNRAVNGYVRALIDKGINPRIADCPRGEGKVWTKFIEEDNAGA